MRVLAIVMAICGVLFLITPQSASAGTGTPPSGTTPFASQNFGGTLCDPTLSGVVSAMNGATIPPENWGEWRYGSTSCWLFSGSTDFTNSYFVMRATNPSVDNTLIPTPNNIVPYNFGVEQWYSHPANQVVKVGLVTLVDNGCNVIPGNQCAPQTNEYQICYVGTCVTGSLKGSQEVDVTSPISGNDFISVAGSNLMVQYVQLGSNAGTPTATLTVTPTPGGTGPLNCGYYQNCNFDGTLTQTGGGTGNLWSSNGSSNCNNYGSFGHNTTFGSYGVFSGCVLNQNVGTLPTLGVNQGYLVTLYGHSGGSAGQFNTSQDNGATTQGMFGVGSLGTVCQNYYNLYSPPATVTHTGGTFNGSPTSYTYYFMCSFDTNGQSGTNAVIGSSGGVGGEIISPTLYLVDTAGHIINSGPTATPTQTATPTGASTSTPTPISYDGTPQFTFTPTRAVISATPGAPTFTTTPTATTCVYDTGGELNFVNPCYPTPTLCGYQASCTSTPHSSCAGPTINMTPPNNLVPNGIANIPVLGGIANTGASLAVGIWNVITGLFVPQQINCDFMPIANVALTKVAVPNLATIAGPLQTAITTPCGYLGVQNIGFNRPNIHTVVPGYGHAYAPTVQVSQPISIGVDGCASPWITYFPLGRGFIDFAMWVWFGASTLLFIKSFFTSKSFGSP